MQLKLWVWYSKSQHLMLREEGQDLIEYGVNTVLTTVAMTLTV